MYFFINLNTSVQPKDIMEKSQSENTEQPRKGWTEAFQEMAKNGDDELAIPDVFEDEDWMWK